MDQPINNVKNNLHCPVCFKDGGQTMRFSLIMRYKNSQNTWVNNFPCMDSLLSFLDDQRQFLESYHYNQI